MLVDTYLILRLNRTVGFEMAVPNDSLHKHYRSRGQDEILGLGLLRDGYEQGATFSQGSPMTSIGGLQTSGFDPAMTNHSLRSMSCLGQQAHITQQFRREKLRVQSSHHASPPQSGRPSERSAFSSLASQQSGHSQSSDRLEMSLSPLQTAQGDFGHFLNSAHTHRTFNTDIASLQGYNTSTGDDVIALSESGNNLIKASALGALLKPAEVGAYFDEQTTQVGNNSSVVSKTKNPSLEPKNAQEYNFYTPWIHETDVFDDGQAVVYSQATPLAAGASMQGNLGCSNAANESIETAYAPASINSEDGVQRYFLRQQSARHPNSCFVRADLGASSGQQSNDGNVNQLYKRISTPPSLPTQRHADLQCFRSSISTPSDDRRGSSYGLSQTATNYGQNGDWLNAGTELLALLPGSETIGRSQSSELHGNVNPVQRSVSLDEMVYTSSIPLTHWDKLNSRLGNSGRIGEAENFSRGYVRQSPGGLSLFLSSDERRESSIPGLDAKFSHSGTLGLLRNSKYLRAAQQVLDEFCHVGRSEFMSLQPNQADQISQAWMKRGFTRVVEDKIDDQAIHPESLDQNRSPVSISVRLPIRPEPSPMQLSADERSHLQLKKGRLIGMVEELDRRYRQYRDQMQLVITSFESGTGLGAAAPYTTLARQAMSKRFRSLRDSVSDQIQKVCKTLGEELSNVPILNRGETPRLRVLDQRLRYQRALQQIGMLQQQAWRPQRGLPERSVSVLRAWLFEHFLHPYPKDSEKLMLARLTGLSRSQVSNWFINARVRLWKPMVEEMYVEESKELDEEGISTAAVDSKKGQNRKEETAEQYRAIKGNLRQEDDAEKDMASSSFTQNLQVMSDNQNYTSDAGGTSDSGYDANEGGSTGGVKGRSGYTSAAQLQQSSSSLTKEMGGNYAAGEAMQQREAEGRSQGESRQWTETVVVNKNLNSMMGSNSSSRRNGVTLSLALPDQHVFASHPLPF